MKSEVPPTDETESSTADAVQPSVAGQAPSPGGHVEDTWPSRYEDKKALKINDFFLFEDEPYDRGREVARGGLGRIIECFDRRLGRRVALKELISQDPKSEARFIREACITARLEHPSIVPIHEAGRRPGGERFYVMKLVEGMTLSEALMRASDREERLGLLPHLIDVADAVAYAHSQGILHRDLKPANVMVGQFGETVVIDWGLAKDLSEPSDEVPALNGLLPTPTTVTETSDGMVVGTPPYMPPEQARAEPLDERSDVYALGAMLYHVLSGRRPYQDVAPKQVLLSVVSGPPEPIEALASDMPRDLLAIVRKAMQRNPALRYSNAKDMADELRRFTTGQLVGAHRYSPVERSLRFVRRNIAAVTVAALLLTVMSVFAVWSFQRLAARTKAAELAQEQAAQRVRELILQKAQGFLTRDPTEAVAWLKAIRGPMRGLASTAADAENRGVARSVMTRHVQEVDLVRYDPWGRLSASASRDGTVRLWSPTGLELHMFDHQARVSALTFSKYGNWLATGAYDGRIRLFRSDGAESPRVFVGHTAPVTSIRFAARGDRLVSLGRDSKLRLWTLDGEEVMSLEIPPVGDWSSVAFLDDGRSVVTAGHGSTLMIWDLDQGLGHQLAELASPVTSLETIPGVVAAGTADGSVALLELEKGSTRNLGGHTGEVRALQFSPDHKWLATSGFDGRVQLWPIGSMDPAVELAGHQERVTNLRFSPDGQWLASSSWDGTVSLRELNTGVVQSLVGHGQVVTDLAFSPNGKWLVSSSWDTTLRLWPVESTGAKVLSGHDIGVHAVDFSPSGRVLASGGHDDELRLWPKIHRSEKGQPESIRLLGHKDNIYRVLFSPDGRWVASSSDDQTVRVWPAAKHLSEPQFSSAPTSNVRKAKKPNYPEARIFRGHQSDVEELAFSRDGRWLASAGQGADLILWRMQTGQGRSLRGHAGAVTGVSFVANRNLVSSGADGQIIMWPIHKETKRVLHQANGPVRSLHATLNGRLLVASGAPGEVWVWSMPDGRLIHRLEGFDEPDVVRISPNGVYVAVASARKGLWVCNLAYELCDMLDDHQARVFDLEFSPDGSTLATGSGDHTVRLWDPRTLENRVFRGHRAPVFDVAFEPSGAFIASASGDTDVRVWPALLPPKPDEVLTFLGEMTSYAVPNPLAH